MSAPRCYTVEQLLGVDLLNMPRRTFFTLRKAGRLPFLEELKPRLGKHTRTARTWSIGISPGNGASRDRSVRTESWRLKPWIPRAARSYSRPLIGRRRRRRPFSPSVRSGTKPGGSCRVAITRSDLKFAAVSDKDHGQLSRMIDDKEKLSFHEMFATWPRAVWRELIPLLAEEHGFEVTRVITIRDVA